ncbi:IS3 family transposase [Staphylococcus agnetis]|uniref:IS3 family transposase n=1 Tax=Staphylococcus agnetis TaxID=985762 RepID=UPI003B831404
MRKYIEHYNNVRRKINLKGEPPVEYRSHALNETVNKKVQILGFTTQSAFLKQLCYYNVNEMLVKLKWQTNLTLKHHSLLL